MKRQIHTTRPTAVTARGRLPRRAGLRWRNAEHATAGRAL